MRKPTAIAAATTSLLALMFLEVGMDVTGNDAAVAGAKPKPEYAVASNPYLPIKRLRPVY
jgi:hypothetical protein